MGKSKEWDVVMVPLCRTKGRAPRLSVLGVLLFLLFLMLCIDVSHELLKLCHVFFTDGRLFVVIVCVEYHWEHVGYGLTFRVAHGVDVGVDTFGEELVLQRVALAVAPDDAAYLPEAEVVEEFTTRDAYLAHEQLIYVVGGG